jgi:hypothetical protein
MADVRDRDPMPAKKDAKDVPKQTLVTNMTENTPFILPEGTEVPPQTVVSITNWEHQKHNDVVKSWLDSGALKEGDHTDDFEPVHQPSSTPPLAKTAPKAHPSKS